MGQRRRFLNEMSEPTFMSCDTQDGPLPVNAARLLVLPLELARF